MSALLRQTAMPLSGGRVPVAVLVAAAHVGGLALLGLQAAPERFGGEAPVINLTLEPSARFDSPTPPAAASTASRESGHRAPAPTADRLRLRLTASALNAFPVAPPTPIAGPVPAVDAPRARPEDAGTGTAHGTDDGQTTADAAVAGRTQGGGGRALGAAAVPEVDAYAAEVLAWIERHKRHPGGARGVVTVSFELDRRGRVHRPRLVRSGGVRALDRAALDQITATQPFPRPDPGTRWSRREFTVNIDYRARGGAA